MIGWLLNTESGVYHPINDLGMLYPSAYVTDKPGEPIMGTLTPVRDSSGYVITEFQIRPYGEHDSERQ